MISFWTPVRNGLTILAVLESQIWQTEPYSGYILFDSDVKNFNRQVIFFNMSAD